MDLVVTPQPYPHPHASPASLMLSDGEREYELVGQRSFHGIYVLP